MAVNFPEQAQLQISGLNTAGHPLARPRGSSFLCDNFRVMPGGWLRLRSGRKLRLEETAGKFINLHPYRWLQNIAFDVQFAQHATNDTDVYWQTLDMTNAAIRQNIQKIETKNDGAYGLTHPVASVTIRDRVYYYNGLGVRDSTTSDSPVSTWHLPDALHIPMGIDAWCPNGFPTATFTETVNGSISIQEHRQLWVGLHSALTGHYSNAVFVARFDAHGDVGQIVVNDLHKLLVPIGNDSTQQNDAWALNLHYVFYITVDGGEIPYLIMDQTMVAPFKTFHTNNSVTLNFPWTLVDPMLGGVYADQTKEMPTTNFPPRPMRSMCYVNGRVYGVLLPNAGKGTGAMPIQPDAKTGARKITFTYETKVPREQTGVYWSNAARDSFDKEFVGVPEHSWPQDSFAYTPSGETPLVIDDAKTRVLVICPTSCFLLEETADGIHEWTEISRIRGIKHIKTLTKTTYGHMWVTQTKEIVLLPSDSAQLIIASKDYQSSIDGEPVCASYWLDPRNHVDRYQVWLDNNKAICHDFGLQTAYTESPHHYECAKTLVRNDGARFHVVANRSLYTVEGQPENGLVVTMDDMPASTPRAQIKGRIYRNWDDFGDAALRKDFSWVDAIAQDATLQMLWKSNFAQVADAVEAQKTPQSLEDFLYRFKMRNPSAFWYQFGFLLDGTTNNRPQYYSDPGQEANLPENFYGCILRVMYQAGASKNRT
jgi:hypothetical protein